MKIQKPAAMGRRLFTHEEAERTLPLVRRVVEDIQGHFLAFRARKEELERLRETAPRSERSDEIENEIEGLASRINDCLGELEAVGCQMKDFEKGLVDFYTDREGEIACLCWMQGEDRIRFWHTVEGGFAGRRPLARMVHEQSP